MNHAEREKREQPKKTGRSVDTIVCTTKPVLENHRVRSQMHVYTAIHRTILLA